MVGCKDPNNLGAMQSDRTFVDLLAEIRSGRCLPKGPVVQRLQDKCGNGLDTSDGILPTKVSLQQWVGHVYQHWVHHSQTKDLLFSNGPIKMFDLWCIHALGRQIKDSLTFSSVHRACHEGDWVSKVDPLLLST